MSANGLARTRLILNVAMMLAKRGTMKLSELTQEFGVSREEMQRILHKEINMIGVPPYSPTDCVTVIFDDSPRSKDRSYSLLKHHAFREPVCLLKDEAIALQTLLAAFDGRNESYLSTSIGEVAAKISATAGVENGKAKAFVKAPTAAGIESSLDELEYAVNEHQVVEIEYYSGEHRRLGTRRVRPYLTIAEGGRYYLRGFCELRQGVRSFRIDRIRSLKLIEETFSPPKKAKHRPTAMPGWDGTRSRETFSVRFEPVVAEEVARNWETKEYPARFLKDGSLELKLPLYSRSWAIGWVLSFGPTAELIAPEGLREQLVQRIQEMLED